MKTDNETMDMDKLMEEYEEALIKLAMASYAEHEGKLLMEENEELKKDPSYQPTIEAKRKFKRVIDQYYYKQKVKNILHISYRSLNKTAMIFLVLILLLSTSVLTVQAIRIKALNLLISMEDRYTAIRLGDRGNGVEDNMHIDWHNAYMPTNIPEGYIISNLTNNKNLKSIEYTSKNGGIILFQQINENGSKNVDTENAEKIENVTVQGKEGLLVIKDGLITVIWNNDLYVFLLSARTEELRNDDVLKIAESVIWVK